MKLSPAAALRPFKGIRSFAALQQALASVAGEREVREFFRVPKSEADALIGLQEALRPSGAMTARAWQAPDVFFDHLLPSIGERAAACRDFFPTGLPIVDFEPGKDEKLVLLPRPAVASIVAAMFLCALELPDGDHKKTGKAGEFNRVHCAQLLTETGVQAEKLKCFLAYFAALASRRADEPEGFIAIRRVRAKSLASLLAETKSGKPLPLKPIAVFPRGSIDGVGTAEEPGPPVSAARTNFANRYLGGGILSGGTVQEEILIEESPELLAASALVPVMTDTEGREAVIITGCERFSFTTGYARGTKLAAAIPPPSSDYLLLGGKRVLRRCVVAIDALPVTHLLHEKGIADNERSRLAFQLQEDVINRELNKSFVGFSLGDASFEGEHFDRIATGKWGCGAFGGNDHVKALIQWVSASAAGRPMDFFCFEGVTPPPSSASAAVPLSIELSEASAAAALAGVDCRHLHSALIEYGRDFDSSTQAGVEGQSIIKAVVARALAKAKSSAGSWAAGAAGV